MKVYLDNCCYNRPFDDRSNIKNYLEREAVLLVFELVYKNQIELIGSEVLQKEISFIKDDLKRERIQVLYQNCIMQRISLDSRIVNRANEISSISRIKSFDSLHLASAENNADIFLTTDIKLYKASKKIELKVEVMNPIEFIMEVINND